MACTCQLVGLVINWWHQMKTVNISNVKSKSRPRRLVVREVSRPICVKFGQYNIFLTKRVSQFTQCWTDWFCFLWNVLYTTAVLCYFAKHVSKLVQCFYIIRRIKVNFMRHLALLRVVSQCPPPPLFGAALSGLAISVAPRVEVMRLRFLRDTRR